MNSPFPGMDPYLEQFWGDIHTRFMVYACDRLNEQLPVRGEPTALSPPLSQIGA